MPSERSVIHANVGYANLCIINRLVKRPIGIPLVNESGKRITDAQLRLVIQTLARKLSKETYPNDAAKQKEFENTLITTARIVQPSGTYDYLQTDDELRKKLTEFGVSNPGQCTAEELKKKLKEQAEIQPNLYTLEDLNKIGVRVSDTITIPRGSVTSMIYLYSDLTEKQLWQQNSYWLRNEKFSIDDHGNELIVQMHQTGKSFQMEVLASEAKSGYLHEITKLEGNLQAALEKINQLAGTLQVALAKINQLKETLQATQTDSKEVKEKEKVHTARRAFSLALPYVNKGPGTFKSEECHF